MNNLQETTFGDNNIITWYQNLSKKERKEFHRRFQECLVEAYIKHIQTLTDIKDFELGDKVIQNYIDLEQIREEIFRTNYGKVER